MAKSDEDKKTQDQAAKQEPGKFSFLWRILSIFDARADPERAKRHELKEIAKRLRKSKYNFYKAKSGEAQSDLGRFFYDIYKAVSPSKILIDHAEASQVLKSIVIESHLSEEQKEIQNEFEESAIRARLEQLDPKSLATEYKNKIVAFLSGFDSKTVQNINATYNLLATFIRFINYDYYFTVKKFDSLLPENDFKYRPRFDSINGEYITDDVKDFLEVAALMDPNADWTDLFDMLALYKGAPVMTDQAWRPVISRMTDVIKSGVLVLMVRHIDSDPSYKNSFSPPNEKIVEEYLNKIKTQTEITIQKILNERRANKIDSLAKAVFGTTAVSRMRNYTEKANVAFSKKMLGGYIYVEPMNYLKAFLLDYLKSDIKGIVDVLLIRGQWSTGVLSQQLSDAFHRLLQISQDLLGFDERLAEDTRRGTAMKNALYKSDRDKSMVKVLRQYLDETNKEALTIIREAGQLLITVAKLLKTVLDDYTNRRSEVVINWREIEQGYDKDIKSEVSTIYKKIYYLTQLLQYYTKSARS